MSEKTLAEKMDRGPQSYEERDIAEWQNATDCIRKKIGVFQAKLLKDVTNSTPSIEHCS